MATIFSRLCHLVRGLKLLAGAGLHLLLTGVIIEGITFGLNQWISIPLNLTGGAQVVLSVPFITICLSGLIWFNRTLNLPGVFLSHRAHELITHGPFSYVRHPLYATLILTIPPLVIIWCSDLLFTIPWFLIVIVSHRIVLYEERVLLEIFGEDYARYIKHVPALIPFVGTGRHCQRRNRNASSTSSRA